MNNIYFTKFVIIYFKFFTNLYMRTQDWPTGQADGLAVLANKTSPWVPILAMGQASGLAT